jgi:hypothetical protein
VRNAEWEAVGEGFAEGESGRGGEGERAGVSSQEETAFEEVLELLAGEKTLQSRRRRGAW